MKKQKLSIQSGIRAGASAGDVICELYERERETIYSDPIIEVYKTRDCDFCYDLYYDDSTSRLRINNKWIECDDWKQRFRLKI